MRIGVTQRVLITSTGEIRDSLDHRWVRLFRSPDYLIMPLPNSVLDVSDYLSAVGISSLILTGGEDFQPSVRNDPFSIRDHFEQLALDWAIKHKIPVLGVCRGFQLIATYFGAELRRVSNHAGTRHQLKWLGKPYGPSYVASHHNLVLTELPTDFVVLAEADDQTIECAIHSSHHILGLMWHPERAEPNFPNKSMIEEFLNRGGDRCEP